MEKKNGKNANGENNIILLTDEQKCAINSNKYYSYNVYALFKNIEFIIQYDIK